MLGRRNQESASYMHTFHNLVKYLQLGLDHQLHSKLGCKPGLRISSHSLKSLGSMPKICIILAHKTLGAWRLLKLEFRIPIFPPFSWKGNPPRASQGSFVCTPSDFFLDLAEMRPILAETAVQKYRNQDQHFLGITSMLSGGISTTPKSSCVCDADPQSFSRVCLGLPIPLCLK